MMVKNTDIGTQAVERAPGAICSIHLLHGCMA